jgi:hypothetical protein
MSGVTFTLTVYQKASITILLRFVHHELQNEIIGQEKAFVDVFFDGFTVIYPSDKRMNSNRDDGPWKNLTRSLLNLLSK